MSIYNASNVLITPGVQSAVSRPDVIEVQSRLLDGKYFIQTVGTGGTLLDVTAHFTMAQKMAFDTVKRLTSTIRVVFDGRYYTGIVSGQPTITRNTSTYGVEDEPIFTISFVLLVETEGVA